MSKLTRVTAKVFGATADGTLADPEIGQFGSAKAGTYNGTGDVATIQSLSAWSNGWIDAVTPTQQFPSLPERTGVDKVLSYQNAYVLQQGIPEWDSATDYHINGFCSKGGKIYKSTIDDNLNNDPELDTVNWEEVRGGLTNIRNDEKLDYWVGTRSQYDALVSGGTVDSSTIYNITDDTDVTLTLLNLLYPVGAIYIGTMATCPLAVLGVGTWVLKATDRVLQGAGTYTAGATVEAGLPNLVGSFQGFDGSYSGIVSSLTNKDGSPSLVGGSSPYPKTVNIDASSYNSIYGNSNTVQPPAYVVNIWERTA